MFPCSEVFYESLCQCLYISCCGVCTLKIVVFPDCLSLAASSSSAIKTSDTTEGDSETSKPVDEGEIQIEFPSDYFNCPNIWAVKKSKKFGPV